MAEVKNESVWKGVTLIEYTDTETGVTVVKGEGFLGLGAKEFVTANADGSFTFPSDSNTLYDAYNSARVKNGKPVATKEEFEKDFNETGTRRINSDRAWELNNEDNYESPEDHAAKSAAFIESGIPAVRNKESGEANNSEGKTVEDPENNTESANAEANTEGVTSAPVEAKEFDQSEQEYGSEQGATYRYPKGIIPEFGYDFITITSHEYKAGQALAGSGGNPLVASTGAENRVGPSIETITLPMIPNLEETSSVGWGDDKMNAIQAAAAKIASDTVGSQTGGFDPKAAVEAFASSTQAEIQSMLQKPELKAGIVAYAAGQASNANVIGRSMGAVLNPNLELLFTGPKLRSFNFNFKFRPRNDGEAKEIKAIIRCFKRNMAVQRSSGELFLLTPNIWKIKYHHNKGPHPYMNQILPCAMTTFRVSYTPDNNYMTYADGSMTGYDVSFTMAEIVPIYADMQKDAPGTGY